MSLPPNQFSQNQKEPESNDLTSMIKIIWVPIIGFIGGVTSIVKFIELWRGDRELVTIVTITIGIIALVFSLLYIGYSKKQSPVYARRQIPRYPSFFRLARIGLLALVVATISGGMLLYRQDLMLQDKLVILIANFDGPDSENYRITEYLLASLKKNLNRNKEIVIKPLNKEITEQEGSEVARKTGREHRADIIVWGLYGVTETDVVVSFHMENLLNSGRDFKTKPEQGVYWFTDERPDNSIAINSDQDQITVSESGNLNSFTVQANLSSEILTIINFFSGYVQYTAGNYNEAVSLFDNAIDESRNLQSWPLKSELHFYRSNANFQLRNLEQSILDLTLAIDISEDIKLKSQYYTNRGVVNIHAGFYEDAISDYSEAIQLDPESPLLFMNYNNRGESHRNR
jgi:tetratricopeptide (TPR) repeat protein